MAIQIVPRDFPVFFWPIFCGLGWILAILVAVVLWGCDVPGGKVGRGEVTFLDVGQGLAVLLEQEGRYALYDVGQDSSGLWDSLQRRGIDTLEWVLVSHNHRDHGGSLLELQEGNTQKNGMGGRGNSSAVHIRRLYVGPDTSGGFVRDSLLRVAFRLGIPVDTVFRGDRLFLGDLSFRVLWPVSYLPAGDNGASVVLQAGFAETQERPGSIPVSSDGFGARTSGSLLLLTGDLDSAGENRLMELSREVQSDLLQVGHHGSSGSSSLRFLSQVAPRYGVISVGRSNRYGHPTETVLRKLFYVLGDSANTFRTDLGGSISFELHPGVGVVAK